MRAATRANGLWEPAGGGIFISVLSDAEYSFDDGKVAYVLADYLHCDRLIQPEGEGVLTGTVLAVADNTGFSTGPHTHIQVRRVRKMPLPAPAGTQAYRIGDGFFLQNVDANDANGSFDPTPYFSRPTPQMTWSLANTAAGPPSGPQSKGRSSIHSIDANQTLVSLEDHLVQSPHHS